MTVANNYAPIRQLGNGTTVSFSGSWSMIASAYAVVALEAVAGGARTPVTQGSGANQYNIVITASGFTVTFNTAPTSAYYVDISRQTGLDQTNSYTTSSGFQGQVEENSFDKLTAMVQDAAYAASQAITIPVGESYTTLLPSAAVRANGYLAFDSSGNVIVSAGQAGGTVISAAMVPVVTSGTLALARGAMGAAGLSDNNVFTGTNTFTTQTSGDNSQKAATTGYVDRGASGASQVLLATASASNSASIQFTNIPSGYDQYEIRLTGAQPATNNAILNVQFSENNGTSYLAANYNYAFTAHACTSSTVGGFQGTSQSSIPISNTTGNNSVLAGVCGKMTLYSLSNSNFYKSFDFTGYYSDSGNSGTPTSVTGSANYAGDTNAVNAIKFYFSTGNIALGNFALYGVRKV